MTTRNRFAKIHFVESYFSFNLKYDMVSYTKMFPDWTQPGNFFLTREGVLPVLEDDKKAPCAEMGEGKEWGSMLSASQLPDHLDRLRLVRNQATQLETKLHLHLQPLPSASITASGSPRSA